MSYGRFTEAIELLSRLLLYYSNHTSGRAQLATCYMQTNQTDLARVEFEKALERNPNDLMALNNYGRWTLDTRGNRI